MKNKVQESNDVSESKSFVKMISDPIRSRIVIETMLRGEITVNDLLKFLNINRSAISYHLGLMVENKILSVKIDEIGRPIKRYSLITNKLFLKFDEIIRNAPENEKKDLLLSKLNLYTGTMQMIANLSFDAISQIKSREELDNILPLQNQMIEYSFNDQGALFFPLIFKFLTQEEVNEIKDDFMKLVLTKFNSKEEIISKKFLESNKISYLLLFTFFPLFHVLNNEDKSKL